MIDKTKFIEVFNNIMSNTIISDEDFVQIISILKARGSIGLDFVIDTNKSQQQNILSAIYEDILKFYKIYLGQ